MKKKIMKKHQVIKSQIKKPGTITIPVSSQSIFTNKKYISLALLGVFSIAFLLVVTVIKFPTSAAQNSSLIGIFLTGLITGGLTCMAVQGGLLAATIAQREENRLKEKATKGAALPILSFLGAKLVAYTVLGLLLGLLGSAFQLSLEVRTILQFVVAIFMIGTALNILNVHPIFRYFVIQPPRFLTRLVRKQSKSNDIFAPATLGAFTVFIPCGTTQAMMALAIASGKPIYGAAILFSFILGTSPIFFVLGYFATKLGDTLHQKFMRFAAFAIVLLALWNVNTAIVLSGSNLTFGNMFKTAYCVFAICSPINTSSQTAGTAQQAATIAITANGYNPDQLTIPAGKQVTIHLTNTDGQGCQQSFTIPSLQVQKVVPVGQSGDITFTAPSQIGDLPFMCGMGMFKGTMHVI